MISDIAIFSEEPATVEPPAPTVNLSPADAHEVLPGRREWYYYPKGDKYYTTRSTGDWVFVNENTCRKMLIQDGLSDAITKEDRACGIRLSEVDIRIIDIKTECIVRYAGTVAGWKRGHHRMNGKPVLVTDELAVIKPRQAPDDAPARADGSCRGWPTIGGQYERWLSSKKWGFQKTVLRKLTKEEKAPNNWREEDDGWDQRPYYFAWLARWYRAVLDGSQILGHAVVFAGGTGCGKTLNVQLLEHIFGGESAQPYAYLNGAQFNSDLVSATVMTIDDEVSKTDMKSRKDLAARVKQFVAVPKLRVEGKGVDAVILSPVNRLIFCTNLTEDNLSVLPPPSEDLVDADGRSGKIMLFKFYSHGWEGDFGTEGQKAAFFKRLRDELPAFLHWLLNEFQIEPQHYDDRYGVIPWLHPEILESLEELSAWQRILTLIDKVLFGEGGRERWVVTAEKLHDLLTNDDSKLPPYEKQQLRQNYLHLDEIAQKRGDRCVNLRSMAGGAVRAYAIFREGSRRNDEVELDWMKRELKELIDAKKQSKAKASASAPEIPPPKPDECLEQIPENDEEAF